MFKQYIKTTKTLCLSFFRDKQTIFFVIVLPLIFMIIFGFLYAEESGEGRVNTIAVFIENEFNNQASILEIITDDHGLNYVEVDSLLKGEKLLSEHEVDMILHKEGNNLTLYFNPARMQDNPRLEQQASAVVAALEQKEAGLVELIKAEISDIGSPDASELRFMFPGLIALGLAAAGLFVIVEAFMYYREKGVLKRMLASPMNKNIFLLSLMSSRFPGSLLSALLILISGLIFFQISFDINYLLFIPYILIGTIIMMGFGALITVFTKTADSAVQVASLLLTIMIFFSGIYFPIEFLPLTFQRISFFLPLSYIARGLRFIMGVEQMAIGNFILETGFLLLASFFIIFYVSYRNEWI